jgi:hypothetical protein
VSVRVNIETNYTDNLDCARRSLRYYVERVGDDLPEHGSRDIWGADEDAMRRADAYRLLEEHGRGSIVCHRMVISMADDEGLDMRELVRDTMRRLEETRGQRLHWIAVEHRNTEHPHVHVMLMGQGERETSRGRKPRQVRLSRDDLAAIRGYGGEYAREHGGREELVTEREDWRERVEELDRADDLEREEPGRGEPEPAGRGRADRGDWDR